MPPLLMWLPRYAVPSLLAIIATYAVLRWTQRRDLRQPIAADIEVPSLSKGGQTAALGIMGTAFVLLACSGFDVQLGAPTFAAGAATAAVTLVRTRQAPWPMLKGVSWGVLPLVAGLFVLVEALNVTGLIKAIAGWLQSLAEQSADAAAWSAGVGLAVVSNLVNSLPAGLPAGDAVTLAYVPDAVRSAVLIGVDLGPNVSITGSLATILWLTALRREGQTVGA